MSGIRALLDRPDPESLGLVPIVVDQGGGQLTVSGYADQSRHRTRDFNEASLQQMLRGKSALHADVPYDKVPANAAALWVGNEFRSKVEDVQVSLPPLPSKMFSLDGGDIAIGPPDEMFVYLDRWVGAAFDRFKSSEDSSARKKLAELMHWALPGDPRTLAAAWRTSARPADELSMQVRFFAGRTKVDQWERSLERRLDAAPIAERQLKLVVFTGQTGSEREEVSREFARYAEHHLLAVQWTTLRHVVEAKTRIECPQEDNPSKQLLMEIGQRIVERSPLYVALSIEQAMGQMDKAIAATQNLKTMLVVDSVRHQAVLSAIRWWFEPEVISIGVTAAAETVRNRILEHHQVQRKIQSDPTEIEIPRLVDEACFKVDTTSEAWREKLPGLVSEAVPA